MPKQYDAIIVGAGAAGLMAAIRAGQRGLSVLLLDKADKVGKKILISGGGRCNFTNLEIQPQSYLSHNPHFCKSALSRYTQWHFIELLTKHGLSYSEKTLGQLFCQQKSEAVVNMLVDEAQQYNVDINLQQNISKIGYHDNTYHVTIDKQIFSSNSLVIATGGASIPKLGASDFALRLAKQFKVKNYPFIPALVPLTLSAETLQTLNNGLAGIALPVRVSCNGVNFSESMLFTHRGLSGPAILQISSYWQKDKALSIDLLPSLEAQQLLQAAKKASPNIMLSKLLSQYLPKKLAEKLSILYFENKLLQSYSDKRLTEIAQLLHDWQITPTGSEGMKKAEVCTGGIDTNELSSKTMQVKKQAGLYFIGEAVDVTGWLGGYNFQWAWSSGWCCGDGLGKVS